MASSTWSDLPIDVLKCICEKFTDIKDYIRFGAVCRDCRTVLRICHKSLPVQPPVLLLPDVSFNATSNTYTHKFFHASDFHNLRVLNESCYVGCCQGSNKGWLITTDPSTETTQLLNPFLSINNVIQLPYLSTKISKAVLSSSPRSTSNYMVVVLCVFDSPDTNIGVAFLKPGDTSWSFINCDQHYLCYQGIAYYRDKLYGFTSLWEVVCCDITSKQPKLTRVCSAPPIRFDGPYSVGFAESSGDLLCVAREYERKTGYTVGFQIFQFEASECRWIGLKSLRGHSLFLDNNSSLSLMASDWVNCKPNYIYYAYHTLSVKFDVGAFNIEDGSSQPLISENFDAEKNDFWLIWVQPTLNLTTHQQNSL